MIDLNDIAVPKTRHDLAAVKERLACTAADWLPGLFPEARLARDRRSLRCADLSGRPPRKEGSCTIHLDGPYAGWGFDYATGERAGPIDLIAQATGLCDGALFDEAARLAGMDLPAPRPALASPMRARPDHSAEIARLVAGAVPLAGTLGETYLRARGLSDPGTSELLFHPDLPDFDSCRGWPGLIAILRLPDGERAPGIHRTFLLDDGSAKAPPGKKMLGSVKDAVLRLFPMLEDGHIGIAEGIETALAAHALFGTPVWAALSADGLARFHWPEGTRRVTIYADAGDAGRQAAATLSDRLNRADIPNEIVAPLHGDDFNDDLLRGARAKDYKRPADATAGRKAADAVDPETATPIVASADDPATLIAAAEALTNPPEFEALSTLLGRIALAKLDPLPERQVIARIKSATGIGMSVLTQQLAELRRRVNATGDPHAPIPKPAWFRRLRLDLAGAPERNEANVIVALTSDPAFAGVLAFDEFGQEIVVRQPLPWDCAAASLPRPWEDADDIRTAEWLQLRGINVAPVVVSRAVGAVARELRIHPVRDWLDTLTWDGTPRIETWTSAYLGAEPTAFILMDVPPGNTLPNPYSDNAAETGQPAFPWRGRITCSPAAGFAGTVDKTATAATQVAALFGAATPASFSVSGQSVSWTGTPGDWGLRRMVLHYAHLCAAAGGVDAFLIGTEMPGLTTIRSGANTYPAVQAYRDLLVDVRSILGSGTKIGYAADWSEYFGHQPGDGTGDVFFHLDPLWADPEIDFVGIDNYMPLSDWRDGFEHADAAEGWPAIYDRAYLQGNIAGGEGFDWFYASAADRSAQVRTPITDGSAANPWVFRYKDLRAWWSNAHYDRPGGVESGTPTAWAPQSKPIWFTELGCPAIDRGTNQPNVFFDPKSSESFTPHFSRGWRDDAIQRAYLEATYLWWGEAANNPVSSVYGGRMVHVPECAAWTWDARPYPFFPALTDVWTDGANWRLGHWLTGRLGAVSLAAFVRHLCLRAGLPGSRIDVSGLWGAVEGCAITALESPRASITTLSRHFGFDAVETEGVIRFIMRGRASVATLAPDDLVAPREGDVLELTRGQETELPQALKWQVARADEDYDAALVEARRITVDTTRIASESFPMAVPPEEAERRCRRALMEAWVGRETAAFRLPPSRLALDPADAIRLAHDGRLVDLRLVSIADAEARGIEAVRQDRATYDLPPGDPRAASLTRAVVFGAPDAVLMDLPQLTEDQPAHRPLVAAHAVPWPGEMAVFRSPSTDGFELLTTFGSRARIGALVSDFYPGPSSRFDLGNALIVDLLTGTLESVTDLTLFGGANALAVESATGQWEIVQAGAAELLAPGRYRLNRLLRGQRGTEGAMGNPAPAGARVVVLDDSIASLPIAEADLGLPWNWRIGPASRSVSDETYVAQSFTPVGVGLRPFSVAHVEQPWRTPRTPGDLTIRWTRQSRALAADSWGAVEVPLAEELEAYEVEILDGATVKRVLSVATTSAVYTGAQQTTDWGAPLGPGDTLDIRIFQLSALVGRGAPKTVTLTF